jgi:hypothetical protein
MPNAIGQQNGVTTFRFVVVASIRQGKNMTRGIKDEPPLPANFVVYDYLNPSPYFSQDKIDFIESIRADFSAGDLIIIRGIESFIFNKNTGIVSDTSIPGLRKDLPSDYIYVKRFSTDRFQKMMDEFLSFVPPDFPTEDLYKCHMPGCRVIAPNGDRYYPFAFHGNLEQWRKRLEASADFHQTLLGQFDHGKFVLSDGQRFDFSALKVENAEKDFPKSW